MTVKLDKAERFTPAQAGCILDSHRGWRISGHVVMFAHEMGMTLDTDDITILEAFEDGALVDSLTLSTGETIDDDTIAECVYGQGGMCDGAEEWLNTHVAPEGHYFGFWEGDFMLQNEAWWQQESWLD